MDDFPGLLAHDFGFKPQGKSAPMAPPRNSNTNLNLGSGGSVHTRSSSSNKSAPLFDDHAGADGLLFNDVFGGPPKYSESRGGGASTTASSFDYDSIFKEQNSKSASLPVYDKPVYDDDIFDGLPGLKTSSSLGGSASALKFDDVFGSISSPPTQRQPRRSTHHSSPFDELLGHFGKTGTESKRDSAKVDKDSPAFDDLLPGFGRSSSPSVNRSNSESGRVEKPTSNSTQPIPGVLEDPFVVLESTSSSGMFTDPLEEISNISNSGSSKVDNTSVNRGVFDDLDPLDDLGKSVLPEINKRGEKMSSLRTGPSAGGTYSSAGRESVDKHPMENAEGHSQKKTSDDYQESRETLFDMPTASTDFHGSFGQNVSPPPYVDVRANEINSSPRSEEVSESSDDIWLTVSEIPLFTLITSAPPPSRPPPPRPPGISKSEMSSFSSTNSRKKVHERSSFQNSTPYTQSLQSDRAARNSVTSQIDELEDFAMGRTQSNANEFADFLPGDNADKTSSAAASAAMKEAMDKAEAKFKQMREREYPKVARNKEAGQVDKDMQDAQQRELKERQERLDRERQQQEWEEEEREQRRLEKERESEEKEREQRRLERERERARETEREREKARQAVERATREARERAAAEARLRAERAAVGKVAAEARERAERAAVQRAQAEARGRAAAEAKERAERTAAEARERANAEAREREARERAAVARAEADARLRGERAAVERAAAEARERAAAAARANQQKNENDLESFFSTRATSAPRPRANTSDPFFDSQNKGGPEAVGKTSAGPTSSMRKASSTTNIVDDLSSLFGGGAGSSGEFQEHEGETEERRKARLERHQRTQERAAKALAEKNQRDLQVQREQAERHRIAETLDVEIKRWAAGKEGNLRALLSTLQYVLWPECGWQPVSLTDLITGASVKKVYRKATLCIHPDKVQQKGATLQQKYVAEKVFDLLKESWNKFNSEELF